MAQPQPRREADVTRADPEHYQLESENEHVRIIRIRYGPHAKSVMHSHPASVVVFLDNCRIRMTYPDGKTEEREMHAGQTYCSAPEEHLPENLTESNINAIIIELKH
jgi:hypothetical protein